MRTESIHLPVGHPIDSWCHLAKNLYNAANYVVRQELKTNNRWIRYKELYPSMRDRIEFNDFKQMPSGSAQHTLISVDKMWKGFFRSMREWKKAPSKFNGRPKPPGYYDKNGEAVLFFTNCQCKIQDGIIKFPKAIGLELKTRLQTTLILEK